MESDDPSTGDDPWFDPLQGDDDEEDRGTTLTGAVGQLLIALLVVFAVIGALIGAAVVANWILG